MSLIWLAYKSAVCPMLVASKVNTPCTQGSHMLQVEEEFRRFGAEARESLDQLFQGKVLSRYQPMLLLQDCLQSSCVPPVL